MRFFENKRFYITLLAFLFMGSASLTLWNLDVLIRFYNAYQNGTLTKEKILLDIASFGIGRKS